MTLNHKPMVKCLPVVTIDLYIVAIIAIDDVLVVDCQANQPTKVGKYAILITIS